MSGGNDGLNTLVPAHEGRYFDARPTLRIKEDAIVPLAGIDQYGVHPSLKPLTALWEKGQLAAIDGMGFPGQSRSHFAASDTWWTATPGHNGTTGWLGRWLDATGDTTNPLRAIALGGGSPALVAQKAVSTVIIRPNAFELRAARARDAQDLRDAFLATAEPLANDPVLASAQHAIPGAVHAVDLLAQATASATPPATSPPGKGANGGANDPDVSGDPGETQFTDLLRTAAGIIGLGLGTQIILVSGSGFDTHADQAVTQGALLADLATGITQFTDALAASGKADEVLVVTTSEFGRRVAENGSGTDHGNGNVHLLAGTMLNRAQIVGQTGLGAEDQGDVRSTIDSRSLYANALDWLSPNGPADDVLGGHFDRYGLVAV
jgi:uncharacterized protein (DUF1501 family)